MKNLFFLSLLFLLVPTAYSQTIAKIFIVRHAERTAGDDLTVAGVERSKVLKRVLGGTGIKRIFSTDFVRTKKTAKPLADSLGLTTTIYSSIPNLITVIKTTGASQRHLVVGHSDTVDDIISQCGCTPPSSIIPAMPGTQFDNLFLVLLKKTTSAGLIVWSCDFLHLRYGVPTN